MEQTGRYASNRDIARIIIIALIVSGILIPFVAAILIIPPAIDWSTAFRPATLAMLAGQSPYSIGLFFSPPWALVPLVPLALFPEHIGRVLLFFISLASFVFVAWRLHAPPIAMAAFVFSPPVMFCLFQGNLEWMVLLGLIMPPRWGLLLLVIKPQVGAGAILFWLVESWRRGGWRETARTFTPLAVALAVSFAVWGLWPLRFGDTLSIEGTFNLSLWPFTLPAGLALVAAAIRRRDVRPALAASPLFSPHVLMHSWVAPLAAIVAWPAETIAAVVGMWVLVVMGL